MRVPFLDLRRPYRELEKEVDIAVTLVLEGGTDIRGAEVEAFEEEWAQFCEVASAALVGGHSDEGNATCSTRRLLAADTSGTGPAHRRWLQIEDAIGERQRVVLRTHASLSRVVRVSPAHDRGPQSTGCRREMGGDFGP